MHKVKVLHFVQEDGQLSFTFCHCIITTMELSFSQPDTLTKQAINSTRSSIVLFSFLLLLAFLKVTALSLASSHIYKGSVSSDLHHGLLPGAFYHFVKLLCICTVEPSSIKLCHPAPFPSTAWCHPGTEGFKKIHI